MYLVGKNQRFIKIRVLFWPEISATGVFFNFDNERMHPPKYPNTWVLEKCILSPMQTAVGEQA